ncbi:MAG TPA: hypothetical protein VG501_02205 [Rhizomicrobium sp.]|nr:hypothetical protein [Rhizomicrobium sp.]
MTHRILWLSLLTGAVLLAENVASQPMDKVAQAIAHVQQPKTTGDVIRNMKFAMEQGLLLEDKFYTPESAEKLLNMHGGIRDENPDSVAVDNTAPRDKANDFRLVGWRTGKQVVFAWEDLFITTDPAPTMAEVQKILGPLIHYNGPFVFPGPGYNYSRELKGPGWVACILVDVPYPDRWPITKDPVSSILIRQWTGKMPPEIAGKPSCP